MNVKFWVFFSSVVICNLHSVRAEPSRSLASAVQIISLKGNSLLRIRGGSQLSRASLIRKWYDRNGDGHIDLKDLKMLVDLDGDGHFDAQDLKELWKRLHVLVKSSIRVMLIISVKMKVMLITLLKLMLIYVNIY